MIRDYLLASISLLVFIMPVSAGADGPLQGEPVRGMAVHAQ